jgi:membrane protein DedA with SNARE-associated domain
MGVLFLIFGGMNIGDGSSIGWMTLLSGVIFLIGALFYFSLGRKYSRKDTTNTDS